MKNDGIPTETTVISAVIFHTHPEHMRASI